MLESYERAVRWGLRKNPDFFIGGRPYLDGYDVLMIPDESTQIAAFAARQVDLSGVNIDLGGPLLEALRKASPNAVIAPIPDTGGLNLYLGVNRPPFNDIRVRQAIRVGIDPQAWIESVAYGRGELNIAVVTTPYKEWTLPMDEVGRLYPKDKAKARQLLEGGRF